MSTKEIQMLVGKMLVDKFHSPVIENIQMFSFCEYDVMSINKGGMICEFEVKISRTDFKKDSTKKKFATYNGGQFQKTPNYFSYVCMDKLISVNEIPSYSGLYHIINGKLIEVKKPIIIHKYSHPKAPILEKVCRVNSERHFLGACRLTIKNKEAKDFNYRIHSKHICDVCGKAGKEHDYPKWKCN